MQLYLENILILRYASIIGMQLYLENILILRYASIIGMQLYLAGNMRPDIDSLRRLTLEVGEVFGIPEGDLLTHFSTKLQKADIFTKGLSNVKFKELRELLVGW